jgi:hypothetical protein
MEIGTDNLAAGLGREAPSDEPADAVLDERDVAVMRQATLVPVLSSQGHRDH